MKRWAFRFQRVFCTKVAFASLFLTIAMHFINFELNYLAENWKFHHQKCISTENSVCSIEFMPARRSLCGLFCNYSRYREQQLMHIAMVHRGMWPQNSTATTLSLHRIITGAMIESLHVLCRYRTPPMFHWESVWVYKGNFRRIDWLPAILGQIYSVLMNNVPSAPFTGVTQAILEIVNFQNNSVATWHRVEFWR